MPNLVQELNSLDFSVYIGGPLQAAVQAQHAASMSQVQFIQNVGFEDALDANGNTVLDANGNPQKKLRYVDFNYEKSIPNPNYGKSAQDLVDAGLPAGTDTLNPFLKSDVNLTVPFLTMLTMPALRIEQITIDFNAKLTSAETSNVSSEFAASAELGINYKVVNFKASASYKRTASNGVSVEKTYNLGVHVSAVNDELPAGLDRVLTMLEDSIASV
jgi:hypothetical protein